MCDVEILGFGAVKKEFSRCLQCKKVALLKHRQGPWAKQLLWGCEKPLILYFGVGESKGKFPEGLSYAKDSQAPGG